VKCHFKVNFAQQLDTKFEKLNNKYFPTVQSSRGKNCFSYPMFSDFRNSIAVLEDSQTSLVCPSGNSNVQMKRVMGHC
jgi:hypothetical protein